MEEKIKPRKYDIVTKEGTFVRGVIYTEKPSDELKIKDILEEIKKLKELRNRLCQDMRINKQDLEVDKLRFRLLTSRRIVVRHEKEIKQHGLIPAIVEEDPNHDFFELEIEFL